MYESRFGITGLPFQLSPDPAFYFGSRGHRRALDALRAGLAGDAGVVLVTGEIGAGKTTLVRTLLGERTSGDAPAAQIFSTQLDAAGLIAAAAIAFGVAGTAREPRTLAWRLLRFVCRLDRSGRRALLVIDEAQNLHADALVALAAFANRRYPRQLPLQVLLVGQPELRARFEATELAAVRAMVTVSCHLGPIDRDETGEYVMHRLRKVGWRGDPAFEPAAFDEMFRWTGGIPRRINVLCNRLMLARAMAPASASRIDAKAVAQTAGDLRDEIDEGVTESFVARTEPPADEVGAWLADAVPRRPLEAPRGAAGRPLLCVVASHSDHVKAAALMQAIHERANLPATRLVRVYGNDALALTRPLFDGLEIDKRLVPLDISRAAPQAQAAELRKTFGFVVDQLRPGAVIVFDGHEPAYVCGTVARAAGIAFVQADAGLRLESSDATGLQIRQRTDHLADLLCTADAVASGVLTCEGVARSRILCVGSLLVDAVGMSLQRPFESVFGQLGEGVGSVRNSVCEAL